MNHEHHPVSRVKPLAMSMLLSLLTLFTGCATVQLGPPAYEMATALDRVLEKRDVRQLQQAEQWIDQWHRDGEIGDAEFTRLSTVVTMAKADDWHGARAKLRRLLADQTDW